MNVCLFRKPQAQVITVSLTGVVFFKHSYSTTILSNNRGVGVVIA